MSSKNKKQQKKVGFALQGTKIEPAGEAGGEAKDTASPSK